MQTGRDAMSRVLPALMLLAAPAAAHASLLSGEALDGFAMGIAWFVIVVMPIGAIVLFWMVHVLPERIAHKRHHPQRDAIHVLCLLSLVFGGLLWPLAWLWAYTRPTLHRMAYGTDKHEDYFVQMGRLAQAGELGAREIEHLRHELDAMAERGMLPGELKTAREQLAGAHPAAQAAAPAAEVAGAPAGGAAARPAEGAA